MGTSVPVFAALAIGAALISQNAAAQQAYPTRSIRLIVPAAPGGGTDYTARTIGQKLTESMGQAVIVDNRPGAAGNIGVEIGAKASPDGYTLVMPITSFAMNPHLYRNLPFDTVKDFAPVVLASIAPLYLVINPSVPAKSVGELIALAKAKPGELNYANSGNGTSAHLAGELFKKMAAIDLVSLPYKGGGPAVIDLVAGHVHIYFPRFRRRSRRCRQDGYAGWPSQARSAWTSFPMCQRSRSRACPDSRLSPGSAFLRRRGHPCLSSKS